MGTLYADGKDRLKVQNSNLFIRTVSVNGNVSFKNCDIEIIGSSAITYQERSQVWKIFCINDDSANNFSGSNLDIVVENSTFIAIYCR